LRVKGGLAVAAFFPKARTWSNRMLITSETENRSSAPRSTHVITRRSGILSHTGYEIGMMSWIRDKPRSGSYLVTHLAFNLDLVLLEDDALDYYPWIIICFPGRGEFARVSGRGLRKRRKIAGFWSRGMATDTARTSGYYHGRWW